MNIPLTCQKGRISQVKIHAKADITGFKTNDPKMEAFLNNPSNIKQMVFTISDGTTEKTQKTTSFTALNSSTDFTFDYLPNHIEDGDSDLDDTVNKDYTCKVQVDYYRQCHGTTTKDTSTELIKKKPQSPMVTPWLSYLYPTRYL